jgi:hypothetical protein
MEVCSFGEEARMGDSQAQCLSHFLCCAASHKKLIIARPRLVLSVNRFLSLLVPRSGTGIP